MRFDIATTRRWIIGWAPFGFCAVLSMLTLTLGLPMVLRGSALAYPVFLFIAYVPMCFFFACVEFRNLRQEIEELRRQVQELRDEAGVGILDAAPSSQTSNPFQITIAQMLVIMTAAAVGMAVFIAWL